MLLTQGQLHRELPESITRAAVRVPGDVCGYEAGLRAQLRGYLWDDKMPVARF